MLLYQSVECFGEFTTTISEDLTKVLEKLENGIESNFFISIWQDGKIIFSTKEYGDFNYDDVYIEIMSFINGGKI
jgi:hypothetical protein